MRAHLHPDSVTWKLHFNEDFVFLFTSTSSVQGNFTSLLWKKKKKKKNKLQLSHILKSSLDYEMPRSCNVALRTIAYFSTCMVRTTEIWVNNKQIAGATRNYIISNGLNANKLIIRSISPIEDPTCPTFLYSMRLIQTLARDDDSWPYHLVVWFHVSTHQKREKSGVILALGFNSVSAPRRQEDQLLEVPLGRFPVNN